MPNPLHFENLSLSALASSPFKCPGTSPAFIQVPHATGVTHGLRAVVIDRNPWFFKDTKAILSPKQASCLIHLALRNACLPSIWSQVQATANGQVAGLHSNSSVSRGTNLNCWSTGLSLFLQLKVSGWSLSKSWDLPTIPQRQGAWF